MAISNDNTKVAINGDMDLYVWNLQTGNLINIFTDFRSGTLPNINSIAFNNDSTKIIVGTHNMVLK